MQKARQERSQQHPLETMNALGRKGITTKEVPASLSVALESGRALPPHG